MKDITNNKNNFNNTDNYEPFLMVYLNILSSKDLNDIYEKYIYLYMLRNIDKSGFCKVSIKQLHRATNISISKCKKCIKNLCRNNIILKFNEHYKKAYDINKYFLVNTPDFWQGNTSTKKDILLNTYNKVVNKTYSNKTNNNVNYDYRQFIKESLATNVSPYFCRFVKVSYEVIDCKKLSVKEKMVYITLKSFKHTATNECYPTIASIAMRLNISKGSVCYTIGILNQKNIIFKQRRWDKYSRKRLSNKYFIANNESEVFKRLSKKTKKKSEEEDQDELDISKESWDNSWTLNKIQDYFGYNELLEIGEKRNIKKWEIDNVISVLKECLNTSYSTFKIFGKNINSFFVKYKLEQLTPLAILNVITKVRKYKVDNPKQYIKSALYSEV